jgi:hypothetical protein
MVPSSGQNGVAVIDRIRQGPLHAEGNEQSRTGERPAIWSTAFAVRVDMRARVSRRQEEPHHRVLDLC